MSWSLNVLKHNFCEPYSDDDWQDIQNIHSHKKFDKDILSIEHKEPLSTAQNEPRMQNVAYM